MPYFCYISYQKMKEDKAKRLSIIFNEYMFNISLDLSRIISLYISDISIEEYRYYINLYKNNDNNSIYRIT
tara:strand:+ start:687 stop:899 length:213 start_codon:yes stop_codon:yes gene_type:complete